MKDEQHNRSDIRPAKNNDRQGAPEPRSAEENRIWEALEQARQNVKSVVKKELDAEIVTSELLNLRLRNLPR